MRFAVAILAILVVGPMVSSAEACNCPKEQLLKEYGTVSMLGGVVRPAPALPLPRIGPDTTQESIQKGGAALRIPFLPPDGPVSEIGAIPLKADPLDALLLDP